jgi:hypothetical protein
MLRVRDTDRAAPSCGYCLSEIASEQTWTCALCRTIQHRACAAELLRCTTLGCPGRIPAWDGWRFAARRPGVQRDVSDRELAYFVMFFTVGTFLCFFVIALLRHSGQQCMCG